MLAVSLTRHWMVRYRNCYTSLPQLVERNRQIPYAFARRVINRVCNRSRHADNADLAEPLDAERIDGVVRLVDEDDLDVVHVGVHRDMIIGDVGIDDAAEP